MESLTKNPVEIRIEFGIHSDPLLPNYDERKVKIRTRPHRTASPVPPLERGHFLGTYLQCASRQG